MRHVVAIIPTNSSRSRFYIQQKDESYPIEKYRGPYSFFGGRTNPGEDETEALTRNLYETLGPSGLRALTVRDLMFTMEIKSTHSKFQFTLYESVLDDDTLQGLTKIIVKEGSGHLVSREEILTLPFIFSLDTVIKRYLANSPTS